MVTRRNVVALGAGSAASLALVGLTAGCRDGDKPRNASWNGPAGSTDSPSPSAEPVSLTVTPAADATKVSPTEPVVVTVANGTLKEVTVAAGDQRVAGRLDDDGTTWRSTGTLGYNKTYKVSVTMSDSLGVDSEETSSFKTLKPTTIADVTFQASALAALKRGGTYGVGQLVMVHFSRSVRNRDEAEKAMQVETSPPVAGRWRWLDGQNAHWRPATYFTPGTKISVEVKLHGVDLGKGSTARTRRPTTPSASPGSPSRTPRPTG
ncbi:Ig-like domain-containing protein [Plantactinospora sp. KBS50]|uniref:Ig-like domain-containing protein n=1 Tax=Plantactinospora sp. KBS50 TaxID=2024580 RepID=UPI001E44A661|nr:Ig-like domain-containing protein [Plantactinospora sp. KBS50]